MALRTARTLLFAAIFAAIFPTYASAADLRKLPSEIAKRCGTPVKWVTVVKDEVHIAPSPYAKYSKVDCVLAQLKARKGLKLGFVGNEIDPNQPLKQAWSYIVGGSAVTLELVAAEARKAGWTVGKLAKAEDGSGFLLIRSSDGMTIGQATPFADRIWKHELGEITYGSPPTRNGPGFDVE